MGSKRSEPKPPKFQPVMMDAQGNFYRKTLRGEIRWKNSEVILLDLWLIV